VSGENYKGFGDPELVGLCLKGDSRAWEALILRYRRLIYSIPVKFNFPTADASDVFQAVCLKLIEHLHELKDESKVSAWLITTTTRQCIHVRAQRMRESSQEDDFEEPADVGVMSPEWGPSKWRDVRQRRAPVRTAGRWRAG